VVEVGDVGAGGVDDCRRADVCKCCVLLRLCDVLWGVADRWSLDAEGCARVVRAMGGTSAAQGCAACSTKRPFELARAPW
jgi:hypothetical protein